MNKWKIEVIFVHQNLISNRLTYLVHAKSTGELISFGYSDRSVPSLVSPKRSAKRKKDFLADLSPNLGLSERLIQKMTHCFISELFRLYSELLPKSYH